MIKLRGTVVDSGQATIANKKYKKSNYSKWAYIFLIPFFVTFIAFQLIPLGQTIYYSFFEYYKKLLKNVGPNWVGFANYVTLLKDPYVWKYFKNTIVLWIMGALPQFVIALLLAVIFTDMRLKIKCQSFFKPVIYLPNLVMASAIAMLFNMLLMDQGPIVLLLKSCGVVSESFTFINDATWVRVIIAFMNFLMWFGNTTLLLMSGIIGIDESVFESARIDGAGTFRIFKDITIPLLMPIFVYTFVTSMIGGIQLFDVAQVFTGIGGTSGGPNQSSYTIMMYLYNLINGNSHNYGLAGALSTILFIVTAVLSVVVFKTLTPSYNAVKAEQKARAKRYKKYQLDATPVSEKEGE